MQSLKQTPLHQLHQELGAKLVPFAGYEMPVQYPSGIIHEHLHCRNQVGFFDISHMGQCVIHGDYVVSELEKLTPSNLSGLKIGQQRYTVLTNDEGGIMDDIIITRTSDGVSIIVNAACKEKDFIHLEYQLSDNCRFSELTDQALFALQGPLAADIMARLCPEAETLAFMHACTTYIDEMECVVSRCGYTGEDGFEISVANDQADKLARRLLAFEQVIPIGLGARDTLRLEAGLCLYGHELNDAVSPVEAGLKWIIRKEAAGYPGANIIQNQLRQGSAKHRVGLLVDGKIPVREHSTIFNSEDAEVGYVSSGSFSPSLNQPIAMAYIHNSEDDPDLYALVRNRRISVSITQLPFVPHRYHRL